MTTFRCLTSHPWRVSSSFGVSRRGDSLHKLQEVSGQRVNSQALLGSRCVKRGHKVLLTPAAGDQSFESWGASEEPVGRGAGGAEGAQALVQDLVDGLADGELGLEAFLDATVETIQDLWWGESPGKKAEPAPEAAEGTAGLPAFLSRTCLDACATRVLVAGSPPMVCRPLSSLRLGTGELMQRALVVGHSGEEVVLSWRLRLEESLEPVYKGLSVRERWALVSVSGEPADEEPPQEPTPTASPEAVVQAQLQACQDLDMQRCYNFASPANREAFNDNLSLFGNMLRAPAYSVLLGHVASEVLETKQVSPTKFMAVCGVHGSEAAGQPARAVFIWVCTLQSPELHPFGNCWLTDAVWRADSAAPVELPRTDDADS